MLTVLSFLVAIGILIAVHEWGHYRMAVACGVPVMRFSIGFGRPLLRWRNRAGTEFVIAALPLGGYVRMLDGREGPVEPERRRLAFDAQPLRKRAAIVAAGPAANLLLAVLLYAFVGWWGVTQPLPILGTPQAGSLAEQAGLRAGERVLAVQRGEDAAPQPVRSFEALHWALIQAALQGRDLTLLLGEPHEAVPRRVTLPLAALQAREADAALLQRIGLVAPWSPPVVGTVQPDGAAAAAGLREGDRVLAVDGRDVGDAAQLRAWIRAAVDAEGRASTQLWQVERDGRLLELAVTPRPEPQGSQWVGRVGAMIGGTPATTLVQLGPLEALAQGAQRTWEVATLTLRMLGRMAIGEASLSNLSGPLTMADYAGKSAALGWIAFVSYLALISVSLGVLNLLPLPVLDGGHLMYYLWEAVVGRPLSEIWMERLQRAGLGVLAALMTLAIANDLMRLLG
ncbi:Regulator of sigma-E protease RseP [Tepidimonas alkaliphilus]|uniref:Zinc metalloprotease n=1 Tax=Tepidimonas alkaliphilus TaxID=2588942 RepID=A0A554WAA8_9BURK|nr:RIP metalloprotease RseP [Tepidimonas alkaliphilus]TSE20492.1 Regulator of sigma-E protease RseP [Tepidimonas alkaliphilus]